MCQLSKHSQIILESGKKLDALATITLILRKRQMNVWPGGIKLKDAEGFEIFSVGDEVKESIKVDKAMDLILEGGDTRTVLFSQFKPPLREIAKRLGEAGISCAIMDGETPEELREEIKKDIDRSATPPEHAKYQVVLCNYKTGGVGLNMTGMTQTIILDEEWGPGKRDQAYGRTDRIGQTEETIVHVLRVIGTVDTWLSNLIDFKEDIVNGFDTAGKDLSNDLLEAMRKGEIM